ncbi:uncharacterized protein TA20310 [Theileria annulata]|uniref:SfiI-subtelomeric related protein family member n=1 Tax=Theileria annulata TaxID=5874 RepID=Q4UH95_THEAN|nr:uncharacterized protein TA20310 [Theileria annulata]CAI73544.1 Theileria-specific hypothetical protein [Theileria annulata]|eukprot:XP_954221.1 Theileria-specific hypothetical protein [Theileria annulata]
MKLKLIFLILIDLVICLNNGFPNFDIMNKITNLNPLILDIGLETSNDNYKYIETIYGSIYIPNDGFGFYKIFYLNNDKKIIIYESNIFNEFIKKISCKRFFNNIISILLFLFNGNILQFTNHKHFWILNNQLLFNITKYIYNSDTVLGHTDSTSPTMSTTNSTLGTTGASTVTQGKRANFTATECTMGKGANFTATECTTNTTTNTSGINTVEDPFGVNGIIGHVPDTVMEKTNEIITYKLENGKLQTIKTEINEFKPIENNFINKIIFTNKFTGIDFTIWESNIWYTSAKQITLISLKTYNHVTVLGPTGTGPTGTGATTGYGPSTSTNVNNTIGDITTGYGGYSTGIEGTPLGAGTGAVGATGTGSTGGVGASTVMEEIKLDKLLIILQVDNNYRIFRWDNILNLWIDLSLLSPKLTEMKFYPNDINTNNLFKNYSVYLKGLNYCVEFHYSIDFLRLFTPKLIHTFEYNFINNTVNINNKIFNSIIKINEMSEELEFERNENNLGIELDISLNESFYYYSIKNGHFRQFIPLKGFAFNKVVQSNINIKYYLQFYNTASGPTNTTNTTTTTSKGTHSTNSTTRKRANSTATECTTGKRANTNSSNPNTSTEYPTGPSTVTKDTTMGTSSEGVDVEVGCRGPDTITNTVTEDTVMDLRMNKIRRISRVIWCCILKGSYLSRVYIYENDNMKYLLLYNKRFYYFLYKWERNINLWINIRIKHIDPSKFKFYNTRVPITNEIQIKLNDFIFEITYEGTCTKLSYNKKIFWTRINSNFKVLIIKLLENKINLHLQNGQVLRYQLINNELKLYQIQLSNYTFT